MSLFVGIVVVAGLIIILYRPVEDAFTDCGKLLVGFEKLSLDYVVRLGLYYIEGFFGFGKIRHGVLMFPCVLPYPFTEQLHLVVVA